MVQDNKRLTPEEALKILKKEKKGHLKIYLGYAPGVGKTYSMLDEANRLLKLGQNVVIGYLETHGRGDTEKQIKALKIVDRKKTIYNSIELEEMDLDAIIKLNPDTVLVDELAHTNVPDSKNSKRYEDVEEILASGINVVSTLNIQHLESLNDVVKQITGIKVRETIPDKVVEDADEVELIDISPESLQERLKRGDIYKEENIERSLKNFFRKGNLNALREIALRQTASEVDEALIEYMKEHGIKDNWHAVEKVMVCISSNQNAKKLIRRGARISKSYKCDWIVVDVDCTNVFAPKIIESDKKLLESHYKLAKQLGAEVLTLTGKSISGELVRYAVNHNITQIIIGHSTRSNLQTILRGSTVHKLLKTAKDIEIHVIPSD